MDLGGGTMGGMISARGTANLFDTPNSTVGRALYWDKSFISDSGAV